MEQHFRVAAPFLTQPGWIAVLERGTDRGAATHDLFDLAEHGGSIQAAMSRTEADRVLVIGVETDFLFTIDQQRDLAAQFEATGKPVSLVELDSIQGHDSFLVDMDRFRPVLASFFGGDWGALAALLAASHAGVNPS